MKYLAAILVAGLVLPCVLSGPLFEVIGTYDESQGVIINALRVICGEKIKEINETVHDNLEFLTKDKAVTHLELVGCTCPIISELINKLENVWVLDISASDLDSLESLHIKHENLQIFNASSNRLIEIPAGFFNQTPKISIIDFSSNEILRIESDTFKGADNATQILLNHNQLTNIPKGAFANFSRLEILELSDNSIQDINEKFENNQHLKELHLENNPIVLLEYSVLSLLSHAAAVHISWENVETMYFTGLTGQLSFHLDDKEFISSSNGKIEIHYKEHSFKGLRFFTAGSGITGDFQEISSAFEPSIEYLDLSDSSLAPLNENTLQKFTKLRRLILRNVTTLTDFDCAAVKTMNILMKLDISNNNLKVLKNSSVLTSKRLHDFNATGNQLENSHEIISDLSSSIEVLDLSGNFIGTLNATTFDKLKSLKRLCLSNASLSIVDANPFAPLTQLHTLEINDNNFKHFNFSILSATLGNLSWFEAANCHIENALDVVQQFGPSILKIDLSGNFVGRVNSTAFDRFTNLIYLILSHTNLTDFDLATFEHNDNLELLDLSNNQLKQLNVVNALKDLIWLNVDGNELAELSLTHEKFPRLQKISISHNQIPCEFLQQVHRTWPTLKLAGESWTQKHGICKPNLV